MASIVDMMETQHAAIHHGLAQVTEGIDLWRKDAAAEPRNSLAETIDTLIPVLDEHLALEEQKAIPLIENYTADEYGLTAQEGANVVPPDKIATIFGMMM